MEPDAFCRIQDGGLCDKTLHPHSSVQHDDGDLSNLGVSVLLAEGFHLLLEGRDLLGQDSFQSVEVDALHAWAEAATNFCCPANNLEHACLKRAITSLFRRSTLSTRTICARLGKANLKLRLS